MVHPRALKRILCVVPFLALTVFFAGYLQDLTYQYLHSPDTEFVDSFVDTTVSVIKTVFAPAPAPAPDTATKWAGAEQKRLPERSILQAHKYREDGLLEVNPDGPHPIFELMKRAEDEWTAKLKRSSKTLDDAVAEYERRYNRAPPRGFDDWWFYVEEHNVQLPDEYDQIYHDLEPFWGMDPRDLREIEAEWESNTDSFTLGKEQGQPLALATYSLHSGEGPSSSLLNGAHELIELLADVQHLLSPFRAVFSPHDNPNLATDWELKDMALKAAAAGTYIDINNPPSVKLSGWKSACPPNSPVWAYSLHEPAPPPAKKTFIYEPHRIMDPCLHPSLLVLQGEYLSHYPVGPVPHRRMVPQFSYCPTPLHHDIHAAMPINWVDDINPREEDPEWDDKLDERLLWRGRNTGMWHGETARWSESQRQRLVTLAAEINGTVTVLPPAKSESDKVGPGVEMRKARLNPAMVDVAFAGKPESCPPEVCKKLGEIYEFRTLQGQKAAGQYKYILDVDGNGWSSRFKRLITSNAMIFKATVFPEWFQDRIAPWLHYVPVHTDLSDLYDSLIFFRGDLSGEGAHEDLARKIAVAGRKWSKDFWRKEDLVAYMFRLFLEYARVMSLDREEMSYKEEDLEHW